MSSDIKLSMFWKYGVESWMTNPPKPNGYIVYAVDDNGKRYASVTVALFEYSPENEAVCEHICDLHNAWVSERRATMDAPSQS